VATKGGDTLRTLSLALVCGGAFGNLLDRIRSAYGVVDFIDIGFRDSRWPTFNVADMAVSLGAILLAYVLWGEDSEPRRVLESASTPPPAAVSADSPEIS
jgi:signal peptidase II